MKLEIITPNKNQYKTEMHCHSTCSDGKYTPAELKNIYRERGYSAVCFTDHDVFIPHNDLTDENFVALNGYELFIPDLSDNPKVAVGKQLHLNFLALSPKKEKMLFYNPDYIYTPNGRKLIGKIKYQGSSKEDRFFEPHWINNAIKKANLNGFAVTFNHPVWSCAYPNDYLSLEGLTAMEIWNSFQEDGGAVREMVYEGKEILSIAANDFHKFREGEQSILAAIYIQAEKLTYGQLVKNFLNGNYYSSCGPIISELYIDDDRLHLVCSKVKSVMLITPSIDCRSIQATDGYIEQADFVLNAHDKKVFFLVLTDEYGRKAWTNPIFHYGKKIFSILEEKEKYDKICLYDRYSNIQQSKLEEMNINSNYFAERDIVSQIDELRAYLNNPHTKKVYVQFSQSDAMRFDVLYYLGERYVKSKQKECLNQIKKKLDELKNTLPKDIQLTIFSLSPMLHSANCYDYRNHYVRSINKLLRAFCEQTKMVYIDMYTPYKDEFGKLKTAFADSPQITAELIKKIV